MNTRYFLKKTVVLVVVFQLVFGQAVFAAMTDKDLTLDDGTGDSPSVILTDADDNTLTITKADSGEVVIANDEGGIDFKPSADTDDYLRMLTTGESSYLYWLGVLTYTNDPGIRVNPATGKLEYRDEDELAWTAIDGISGSSTAFSGLSDTVFTSPAGGDVVYFDGTDWLNLGIGTASQLLAVNAGATAPEWVTKASTNAGTAANNTLRWDGSAWVESAVLTNDDTDVTVSGILNVGGNATVTGDLAVNGGDITSTGALTVTPNAGANLNVALSTTGDFIVNTDDLVIDTSTGNVGIGTTDPGTYKLNVVGGDVRVGDNIWIGYWKSYNVGGYSGLSISGQFGPIRVGAENPIPLNFYSGSSTPRMTIDDSTGNISISNSLTVSGGVNFPGSGIWNSAGKVGIGTITPGVELDVSGDIRTLAQGDIRLADSDSTNYVGFQSPLTVTTDVIWTLPAADGTLDQVLKTDGAGTLSWTNAGAGGGVFTLDETTSPDTVYFTDDLTSESADFIFGSDRLDNDTGGTTDDYRMFFDKSKGAFRAGYVTGTEWNAANVGDQSFATGKNTTASSLLSTAMGDSTTASGLLSTAMGDSTTANGIVSTAMGRNTTASGDFSTAIGYYTTASGFVSTAIGRDTIASGDYSTAMGRNTTASSNDSTAIGYYTTASGTNSIAMGYSTTASGDFSTVMGLGTTAKANSSLVLGRYNVISGTTDSWVATDPVFVIGNGTSTGSRANALTVLKNGDVSGTHGSYHTASDRRLKTNITDVADGLDKVMQLRGVTFNWKEGDDKDTKYGLIAQEVEEVMPEIVHTNEKGFKAVEWWQLNGVYVEAIKELNDKAVTASEARQSQAQRIEQLETENTELCRLVERMEARLTTLEN